MKGYIDTGSAVSLIQRLAEALSARDIGIHIGIRLDDNGNLWIDQGLGDHRLAATFQWEEEGPGTCPECGRNVGQRPGGSLNFHGNLNTGVCPGSHGKAEVTA